MFHHPELKLCLCDIYLKLTETERLLDITTLDTAGNTQYQPSSILSLFHPTSFPFLTMNRVMYYYKIVECSDMSFL